MAVASRILLIGGSKALRLFAEDMLKAGHPAYRAETAEQAIDAARVECPDIVISDVDLLVNAQAFADGMAKACSPFRPVLVAVAPDGIDAARRTALEAVIDEVIAGPLDVMTALFRLEPLARLVTMRNELSLRRLTLSRLNVPVEPPPSAPSDLPILVLAVDPKLANALGHAVSAAGARAVFSDNPFQAEGILASEECSALVAVADESSRDEILGLCYQIRKNARLFHLPIMLVADATLAAAPVEAYAQGVNLVLPLATPSETLVSEISAQLQRHNRRRTLRDRLMAVIPSSSLDVATGLVAEPFLLEHLTTLADAYRARRRPLSLVTFSIRNLDAAIAKHGAANANRLYGEVARWIHRLIRAEDTGGRLGNNEFAVVLPNTDDSDARSAMYRVDDVLSHTEFGLDGEPFSLWIASGRATLHSGETAANLLANARASLGDPRA